MRSSLGHGVIPAAPTFIRMACGAAVGVAIACQAGTGFVCNGDDDCQNGAVEGVCQPTGACSFPDDSCESGQRYGQSGPLSVAGECVQPVGGTGDSEGSDDVGSADTTTTTGPPDSADVTGGGCPPDWWDCAWTVRQRIDLERFISSELTDIPVPILLTNGRVDHDRMQADGEDLRFVSASGAVAPYEIERWDPDGVSTVWINLDELGGSVEHLWIYYSNPVAENAQDADAVWPDPYVAVYHLEDDPLDHSGNENHATPEGVTEIVPGQLANGREMVNSSARLDVAAAPSVTDLFTGGGTVSGWMRLRDWGGGNYGRIVDKFATAVGGWLLFATTDGVLVFGFHHGGADPVYWQSPPDFFGLDEWVHFAVAYDALGESPPCIYINGIERDLVDQPDQPITAPEDLPSDAELPLLMGNREDNSRRFEGIFDEMRFQTTVRTAQWIGVQYDATRDDVFSFGPIESLEAGGGTP